MKPIRVGNVEIRIDRGSGLGWSVFRLNAETRAVISSEKGLVYDGAVELYRQWVKEEELELEKAQAAALAYELNPDFARF